MSVQANDNRFVERNMRPTNKRLIGCGGVSTRCRGVVRLRFQVGEQPGWNRGYVLDNCLNPFIASWPSRKGALSVVFAEGEAQFGIKPRFSFVVPTLRRGQKVYSQQLAEGRTRASAETVESG